MIKNNGYPKLLFSYYGSKSRKGIIFRNLIGIIILLIFEFYIIGRYSDSVNILTSNYFRFAIIIPSILLTNIYWNSFRKSDIYRLFSYIPIENKKVLTTLNIYIR